VNNNFINLANKSIQTLNPYQAGKPIEELKRELGLTEVIKLASNENPLGVSYRVQESIYNAIDELARYPDANAFYLKERLATHYNISPQTIAIGNGSNDILDLLAQVFLDKKTSCIYSQHAFIVYSLACQINDAQSIVIPSKNWGVQLSCVLDSIQDNTRLIFIANPNNPTGTYCTHENIDQFLSLVPSDIIVVLDEAYYEYCSALKDYPDSLVLQKKYQNLVITRTFSKAYGLAGLRVGYAIGHESIIDLLNRVRAPFNVNSLALKAAEVALSDSDFIQESIAVNNLGLSQLKEGFVELGVSYIESVANFITIKVDHTEKVYQYLLRQGVIVRPLGVYGMPNHLRVSVGLENENKLFLKALNMALASIS
jgi:histidinol-phosphate aminotransferase